MNVQPEFILTFAGVGNNSSIAIKDITPFAVMNIVDIIINRRSVRKYTDQPVPEDLLHEILRAAMYAPSAANRQPWHFILVQEKDILAELAEIHPSAGMLRQAKLAIIICGDTQLANSPDYVPVDCSAATENILLAAHGLGLGGVWVGLHPREERKKAISELFGLPANIMPVSLVSIGYPAEQPKQPVRFRAERIHYEKW